MRWKISYEINPGVINSFYFMENLSSIIFVELINTKHLKIFNEI